MAHHTHSIPWQTLADSLKFMHCNPRNHGITNLYVRKRPNWDKQLQYFAVGFARALSAFSEIERKKYRPSFISPEQDERVISETAARKISAILLRAREPDATGGDGIPYEGFSDYECTPRHFISATSYRGGDMDYEIQRCCEQTKIMLLCDEMNALFRLAAHPNVYFYRQWDGDNYANPAGFGLKKLMDTMLQAYLCLNVLVLKPELYDATSRANLLHAEEKAHRTAYTPEAYDYRLTAAYQRMLLCSTGFLYGMGDAHTYPHREFFGVPRGTYYFANPNWERRAVRPGTGRVENLTEQTFRHAYLASKADVQAVLDLLRKKSLPTKLALQILKLAEN
ncbi:hypothetical protein E8E13_011294 [Curvularia kusanoi]|uniref:Uncharacterized protein n=1 Tax=Curvularia kusanoi TaxID=90978 RepID=A0A9P4TJP3_CURKU|nr:hypothetical protein E8E13_011294 [Curvularia kusanoi]